MAMDIEAAGLIGRIRAHPVMANSGYAESLRAGSRVLVYCESCRALIAWDRMSDNLHIHCGGRLLPIDHAGPDVAGSIISDLDKRSKEEQDKRDLEAHYPFPPESADGRYTCGACGNGYSLESFAALHSPRRLCCSDACEIAFIGKSKPDGRRHTGFVTLQPCFKGSTVRYLGTARMGGKEVECYWWSVGAGGGSFYAYSGDGKREYYSIQMAFGRQHYSEWEEMFNLHGSGSGADESWRVGANARDGWAIAK